MLNTRLRHGCPIIPHRVHCAVSLQGSRSCEFFTMLTVNSMNPPGQNSRSTPTFLHQQPTILGQLGPSPVLGCCSLSINLNDV